MGQGIPQGSGSPAAARRPPLRSALAAVCAVFLACCADDVEAPLDYLVLELDTDSETESETEEQPDTDTDTCPDTYVDTNGQCIRYVDWDASDSGCGLAWDNAFTDLQEGIDSAWATAIELGHCQVWVADGTYRAYRTASTDSFKLRPHVSVYGGFAGHETSLDQRDVEANVTILDGRELDDEDDRVYHVVKGADDTLLDGFTIAGGRATGDPPHHRGGGIYINAASTHVVQCRLIDNEAIDGGAVFAYDGAPKLDLCEIEGNSAERGGAVFALNGYLSLSQCRIADNVAAASGGAVQLERVYGDCHQSIDETRVSGNRAGGDGGAVFVNGCSLTVTGSVLEDNRSNGNGGALAAFQGSLSLEGTEISGNTCRLDGGAVHGQFSETDVLRCSLVGNTSHRDGGAVFAMRTYASISTSFVNGNTASGDGGGLYFQFDFPWIANTVLSGNRAGRGGAIFNGTRAEPDIINDTFDGNAAAVEGGGLYNVSLSTADVRNCILWQDRGKEIADEDGADTVVSNSNVEGGYPGSYNIDEDPEFLKPGRWDDGGTTDDPSDDLWIPGDYHLDGDSPCIDVGDDDVSPVHDADGNVWIDVDGAGLPDIASDMGSYDYQP